MAVKSVGLVTVTTGGTIVQVQAAKQSVHSIRVQAKSTNTGIIYVGLSSLVRATFVGCIAVLGIPAASGPLPEVLLTIECAPEGLNLADIWLDASVNGEGAIVSYTEQ